MRKKMISLLMTLLFVPLLGFTQEEIKRDDLGNVLLAGYPMCFDVLEKQKETYADIVEKFQKDHPSILDSAKSYVSEIGGFSMNDIDLEYVFTFPSHATQQQNEALSDKPNKSKGGCFEEGTFVLGLENYDKYIPSWIQHSIRYSLDENKFYEGAMFTYTKEELSKSKKIKIEPNEIEDVGEEDLVLSSTFTETKNPKYQRDCWGVVKELHEYNLKEDWKYNHFKDMTIKNKDGEVYTFNVTPKHRFLSNSVDTEWLWWTADSMAFDAPNASVYGSQNGDLITIQRNDDFIPTDDAMIYNFSLYDTHDYYVGPSEDLKVLVHN